MLAIKCQWVILYSPHSPLTINELVSDINQTLGMGIKEENIKILLYESQMQELKDLLIVKPKRKTWLDKMLERKCKKCSEENIGYFYGVSIDKRDDDYGIQF